MRVFEDAGVLESIRHHLVLMLREQDGRDPSPTAAVVETQRVRTTDKGGRAATMLAGRSRAGSATSRSTPRVCCWGSPSTPPTSRTRTGPWDFLRRLKWLYPWFKVEIAESYNDRLAAMLACFMLGLTLIIVRRLADSNGFVLISRRWVAERDAGLAGSLAPAGQGRREN